MILENESKIIIEAEKLRDMIAKEYNSTIATAAQVGSPQNPIVARVAREFGFNSIIGIGGTKMVKEKVVEKHKILKYSVCFQNSDSVIVLKMMQNTFAKIKLTGVFFITLSWVKILT